MSTTCPSPNAAVDALRNKFQGCLLGALLGDCLGSPFEFEDELPDPEALIEYFDELQDPNNTDPIKEYTDDTAMTISVAKCIVDKPKDTPDVDIKHLAKLFVDSYYSEPERGYGKNVVSVFEKLKAAKYEDVYKPALEQFDGRGSYGNGSAMRISPVALCFCDNYQLMLDVASKTTKLTHTNVLGVNGALLQCIAIQQALTWDTEKEFDPVAFVKQLQDKMLALERLDGAENTAYTDKLRFIEELLLRENVAPGHIDEEILRKLGNGVAAHKSVPTAVYCFLSAYNKNLGKDTMLRRVLYNAISLGGDTDTIASMAGAITGAYIGAENVPLSLVRHCEFNEGILELANRLFEAR